MTEQQINQMFEGRWRIKGTNLCKDPYLFEQIKTLCRDFFTAGIMIAEKATVPEVSTSGQVDYIDAMRMQQLLLDSVPSSGKVTPPEDSFEWWWDMYDKKCGHKDCLKKWVKLTASERYACMAATPAYVASTPDKQFRKNPLTYLNQKAWNDEIIPRNNGNSKPTPEQQQNKLADILVG